MTTAINQKLLHNIRRTTREMVRKFGFMNRTLAGTDYSPSAVHALLEIDERGSCTAKWLSERLYLEKSSISRMLKTLLKNDEIEEYKSENDGREKLIRLSAKGKKTVSGIHAFGNNHASYALSKMDSDDRQIVMNGLELYTSALSPDREVITNNEVTFHSGYTDELIGSVTSLHSRIYSDIAGFGAYFEALVGKYYSEFIMRLDNPKNETWYAVLNGNIIGSISIDGDDLDKGQAHLRWFVVDPTIQSKGTGKQLLQMAMDFCDEQGVDEVHLWTFKGLDAARSLYERHGFKLVIEEWGNRYGKKVLERKYIRSNPLRN
ncbi:bifunctional helix-turn-helix transcriptional regulator/GNAT family N-acetyltransferase [Pseudemcibacter aquimaris]|uniref:bifunctional helix-turn-helix transcriptional regulator/GNAT family N-acetyltransferase n=1 Tax=Pseudemcibacter aquimaris TaxID=2857064 RepID=UPI0020129F8C|nr:helix-turn-helix domain-containing GNAT family N-acetyltransferase [Pseudemcibacter aquimaris]MCC3860997.1 helix-turn-helix domain-containing GNAT family N-acetyltransferase [Pseudemcibacter aquimaris]WDU59815.1 helix-turn-helix domain-containing GNAT family N-acetyltransferase [Pseudemcibacter aquimaris]